MNKLLRDGSLILLLTFFCSTACRKSAEPQSVKPVLNVTQDTVLAATPLVPYPVNPVQECGYAPYYGDSIVYPQPNNSGDFYVYPQNNQGTAGSYFSWPAGLSMDPGTGAIDLTQSQTGQRYAVAFVKSGTTDTCMSSLIVAGTAYEDSIYVLSQSDTTARPYFNANPYTASPCQSHQGPGCKFDYNNYAKNQGIVIDQKTGFIDLQNTMKRNPFGFFPLNGATVYTTVYYKLPDGSNNAPQNIQLKLIFYYHRSDIPTGIRQTITSNLLNTLTNTILSQGPTTRPPLIVIVRDNL
jgi:hypothetical protein